MSYRESEHHPQECHRCHGTGRINRGLYNEWETCDCVENEVPDDAPEGYGDISQSCPNGCLHHTRFPSQRLIEHNHPLLGRIKQYLFKCPHCGLGYSRRATWKEHKRSEAA